jgi:hypothetical protein
MGALAYLAIQGTGFSTAVDTMVPWMLEQLAQTR